MKTSWPWTGSNDGVKQDMGVINDLGIVGIVTIPHLNLLL
jgi:cell shape-determining protein MreC